MHDVTAKVIPHTNGAATQLTADPAYTPKPRILAEPDVLFRPAPAQVPPVVHEHRNKRAVHALRGMMTTGVWDLARALSILEGRE